MTLGCVEKDLTVNYLPVDTGYSYEPSFSLKRFILGACAVTCVAFSASTSRSITTVNLSSCVANIPNVISTSSVSYSVYNCGAMNIFCEGGSTMNAKLQQNLQKLDDIASLPENWNYNGASKFTSNIVDRVRTIITELSVQPSVFPTARGSIQFEYERQNGDYLEFELFEDGKLKKFSVTSSEGASTEYINDERIEGIVSAFFK